MLPGDLVDCSTIPSITADGAGLFCGVLKHLLERGVQCPKAIATTHFHDVFQRELLDPHKVPVTFVHMQVLLSSGSGDISVDSSADTSEDESAMIHPGEKITYLYK